MSIVQKLTEGIINRDLAKDGAALVSKWEKTGLLEGLEGDSLRNGMASLLENQAKELLRESSTMSGGDVEGFAAVAFPLVRRVFGNLIANDLVSVQPMSLPSGLIFFLDFTVSQEIGDGAGLNNGRLGYPTASSLFGGNVVGSELTGGVDLSGVWAERGPYGMNNGYASPTGSTDITLKAINYAASQTAGCLFLTGTVGGSNVDLNRSVMFDADLSGAVVAVVQLPQAQLTSSGGGTLNFDDLVTVNFNLYRDTAVTAGGFARTAGFSGSQVRRLTHFSGSDRNNDILLVFSASSGVNAERLANSLTGADGAGTGLGWKVTMPLEDNFNAGGAIGSVIGATPWGLENNKNIPEIDIKVDSIAVTAVTKKLKAKWTPELGQDLNAYHNLDAEVELTQILSEQIALEIDREILEDLIVGATGAIRYWSRAPGRFLDRTNGKEVGASTVTPDFTGNVSEWYETLIETINDVSAVIHRKTLRGGANFIVCGPEVANILEFTAGFRANVAVDSDKGTAGAVKVGSLSKKWDVFVDPYFLRNIVLVGRKGSSFLESGYVYAPYVPLQTTPTIFGVEDFVPRKGVMTRYAKKMVRPDMYGLVVISDLNIG